MRRRKFIKLIGGTVAAWSLVARAQQADSVPRIGVLLPASPNDRVFQTWFTAFKRALEKSGWTIDHNIRIDLAGMAPKLILAHGDSTAVPLLQATRTVPIVFVIVSDPVALGLVDSFARVQPHHEHAEDPGAISEIDYLLLGLLRF